MTDPTSNLNNVQADAFYVWDPASKTHVNLQSSIVGLGPSTLSTLQALASAVGNDSQFITNLATTTSSLQASVAAKADAFTVSSPLQWNVDPTNLLSKELTARPYTRAEAVAKLATKAESTDVTASLNLKAPLASPTFTGTVGGVLKSMVGLGSIDNTSDSNKPVSTAVQSTLDVQAPLANPTFTGTVGGVSRAMVGLGSVDNTSDAAKPVSTLAQAALNLRAPLASPTFAGTVGGISKSMVGLGSVDNTSDAAKPAST